MKDRELEGRRLTTLPTVKRGRPKKFQSVEELEDAIERYFKSCFVQATVERKRWVEGDQGIEEGRPGHFEYDRVPAVTTAGDPVFELIKQPTVTGLAVALDTTRDLLLDYENKPENADFSDTIKRAKAIIHEYAEQYLFEGKNQTSGIFNLKNNFGWNDRTELDMTTKGKQLPAAVISDKVAAILAPDDDVSENENDKQGTA